ncbi:ester cyclase [Cryptosporangium arvum]|uniref:Putative ester cyclase n=1 Tax=Cryptosporangium arvum DSM 44712 TaxID=927661 RepID=A0A010Z6L8_9ACTN|nr:ester cyclase [Cryptosporangium arvum]EXG82953.1 putative ester cyclase [Cryptosporangium arvum DSM 44712]
MPDVAERAIHLMMAGTLDDLREVVHPGATNREAVAEPPACRGTGPEAFWATALWLRTGFSELAFTVDESVVERDLVVTYGRMSGRQTGDFVVWTAAGAVERAFAPTGRRFEVRHAHFQRVRDGLVVEHWAVRDDQSMAMQLGWLPPSPLYLARCARATRRARRAASASPSVPAAAAAPATTRPA